MIKITKGNPTADELAALVAVLSLASLTAEPHLLGTATNKWRQSIPFAEVNPAAQTRRNGHWRTLPGEWSQAGPAHAPLPQRVAWDGAPGSSDRRQVG